MFDKLKARGSALINRANLPLRFDSGDDESVAFADKLASPAHSSQRPPFPDVIKTAAASSAQGHNEWTYQGAADDQQLPYDTPFEPQQQQLPFDSFKEDDVDDGGELVSGKDKIGPWQAGWNVTNAIQGMFIVSLPFTVLHGGWWGVVSMVGVAYICYYTGLILVDCLYEDGRRVRNSYVQIAEHCWGVNLGGRLVNIAQMIELLMTCILYIVLCGDLLEGSFPAARLDSTSWMFLSTMLLLACAFLTNLRAVSWLSFWNTVSHVLINVIVLLYCLTVAASWHWRQVRWTLDIHTFPTVHGIVVFSYTSQIFLPTLEGCMVDKAKFRPMLKWSHLAAAIFKSMFGFVGFLTFGTATKQEVTNNLPSQSFKIVINLILVLKALLSYPLPYYATLQLLETALFDRQPATSKTSGGSTVFPSCFGPDRGLREWALGLRICLILFTLFMAITIPHFALLMGLIGSFTGCMLSFIWPCVFHLKIKGPQLSKRTRLGDWTIIVIGLVSGIIGIIYSASALSRAMNQSNDYS